MRTRLNPELLENPVEIVDTPREIAIHVHGCISRLHFESQCAVVVVVAAVNGRVRVVPPRVVVTVVPPESKASVAPRVIAAVSTTRHDDRRPAAGRVRRTSHRTANRRSAITRSADRGVRGARTGIVAGPLLRCTARAVAGSVGAGRSGASTGHRVRGSAV